MGSLWSWWTLWAGVALLWGSTQQAAVNHKNARGQEFLAAFLQNYELGYSQASLHLFLTSMSDQPAFVSVLSQADDTLQNVTVGPGQSVMVNISSQAEMTSSATFQSAVVVRSDHPISVQAVSVKPKTAELTLLRPVSELGTEYFVLTPSSSSAKFVKEFAVVAGYAGADIHVQLKGSVTFQGKFYPTGKVLSITLQPYQVAQIQSDMDLSGSKVTSSSPVAVFSGHSCAQKHTSCNHVMEQLLPTSAWGTQYVVATLASQTRYDLAYVLASQPTKLTYNQGGTVGSRGLQEGDVVEFEIQPSRPLYLTADVGIQVLAFGTGATRNNVTYDPYLAVVPDVASYCDSYVVKTMPGSQSVALVVVPQKAVNQLTVDGHVLGANLNWVPVAGSDFSFTEVDLGTEDRTHLAEAPARFGLLTFGLEQAVGFGTAGACSSTSLSPGVASCENHKCPSGEHCEVVDGKAHCVADLKVTCYVQGDPHYTTFDGRRYDMMGTCTYTISELCSDEGDLPAFSVEAKNEHRSSRLVSYVGYVTVRAYGHSVSLARGEVGLARIDNQRSRLPVSLDNGRMHVYQSGRQGIVELSFGLVVTYDWDCQLTVTLPAAFRDKVCGLCGNYNGNPKDDFLTPDLEQASNPVELASSWRLDDGDFLCDDGCENDCPSCTPGQAQHYEGDRLCGMLTKKKGPFAACHSALDPESFLKDCVYDLCVVDGDRPSLCRSLSAYAQACLEKGIVVGDWRGPANCPLCCPPNSQYDPCGPACQASCNPAAMPSNCSALPCVEGCVCLPGFVASGDACVPASSCGCIFQGLLLAPGQEVWADQRCRRRCVCDGTTHQMRCSDTQGCPEGEQCLVQNGILGCYPDSFGTCQAIGDPHYYTFDGRRLNFMGTCTYLLTGSCGQAAGLTSFRVLVENEHRGSQTVSYTKAVRVETLGVTVEIRREHRGQVLVDGVLYYPPYQAAGGKIHIYRQGADAVVRTEFGLTVSYNWNAQVIVKVPSSYAGALCGLCGNFDGDASNELTLRGGGQTTSVLEFGNSWQEEATPGCNATEPGDCPNLESLVTEQLKNKTKCGIIADPDGPFQQCHSVLEPHDAVYDCVYDHCLMPGESGLCDALAAYTAACQAAGITVYPWRNKTFCPMQCPPHSHYELCSMGCPMSCGDLPVPGGCGQDCHEACVCDEGFVLSGDICVPRNNCGCAYQGAYYPLGQTFYPGPDCSSLCHCQQDGVVSCQAAGCGPHEACRPSNGTLGCVSVGSVTCEASGDPHYTTFDGRRFDFMGACLYVLASTCRSRPGLPQAPSLPQFTVLQENVHWNGDRVSVTKAITVIVGNYTLRLEQNLWKVTVNGVDMNLPVVLNNGEIRVSQHGSDVAIETNFGLRVTYDLKYYVRVTVPGSYYQQLCGLCGDYNGDPKDDFQKPDGSQASNPNDFGNSWEEKVPGSPCLPAPPTTCQPGGDCGEGAVCTPEQQQQFQQDGFCGFLTNPNGPLAACHSFIDPEGALQDCVFDMCVGNGNQSILCSTIHAYVSACQAAGGQVKPWRNESFCPMICPPNSHYEICADTCSLGCSALSVPPHCPDSCAEGCQCDPGFLNSGNACVPEQDCGCFHNGIYYEPNTTVLLNNCRLRCVCHGAKAMVCRSHTCLPHEVCEPSGGVLSCISKDPCHGVTCRPQEKCEEKDGQGVCVPNYQAVCLVWGDPHYQSFDGRNFNFQGTCDYVLATTECPTGNATGLTPFTITTKNENRGNPAVSYVKQVTVSTLGVNISIHKKEKGHVRVNQVLTALPVSEAGGRITVTQGPGKAVLVTNFGLQVTYDWNARVEVTLPSSYSDAVCGLCGNMDRNVSNDRVFPNGTLAPSNTAWGGSWRVPDSDPFCWDECQGSCPSCSEDQLEQFSGPGFCGPLASGSGGPFAACHAHVPPESYFKGCVIDVCFGGGSQDILCQALAAYAAACQAAGVVIEDWRTQLGCEMPCPQNSHYELCGNPCPASCPSPLPPPEPAQCEGPCAEGCQCDEGFVLSAGQCVSLDSGCGCWVNGTYHEAGSEFWADSTCSQRCRCGPGNSSVVCSPASCGQGEECGLLPSGQLGCRPTSTAECKAWGDPHYLTLDGHRYNFQGACEYLLSAPCHGLPHGLENFTVTVANEHRGSQAVSYTRSASLYIYNHNLTVSSRWPRQLQVDGVLVALPFQLDSRLHAYLSGRDVVVKAANGISMAYDGKSDLRLRVPAAYQGILCGLCGNYNQNATDDPQAVGKNPGQWQVGGTEDCDKCVPGPCPPQCTPEQQAQFAGPDACGIISAPNGPLAPCHHLVPPNQFFEACLLDACQAQNNQEGLCQAVAAYVAACQAAGAQIDEWRRPDFCPLQCPANSHYQLCGDSCPISCPSLSTPEGCDSACIEGCVCDPGFVLSGDTCVPVGQCGCLHEGRYYPLGQTFYPGPDCSSLCHCQQDGVVSCQAAGCGPHEACRPSNGTLGCVSVGSVTCEASGDPHYTTFDGRRFNFMGACLYVLASTCRSQPGLPQAPSLPQFTVLQENVHWNGDRVSVTKAITVIVGNYTLRLEQNLWKVTVNGVDMNLPVVLNNGEIRVSQHGSDVAIETNFGLRVTYDLKYYVRVTVPGSYYQQLCGLCGDYNGDPKDDFQKPDGSQASNPNDFGNSWEEKVPGSPCLPAPPTTCQPGGDCGEGAVCTPEQQQQFQQDGFCGFLTNPNGPLAACHSFIDPEGALQDCVFDMCVGNGNQSILCSTIHAYVSACQAAGGQVKPWRNESFCPMICPPNSHYEICADTCSLGCSALSAPPHCPDSCAEGCQCDPGFLNSGNACVPEQDCGCFHNGIYYEPNTTVLLNNCRLRCVCHGAKAMVCRNHTCLPHEVCEPSGGVLSCISKDPCHGVTCRPQEKCEEKDGQGVCVPNYQAVCLVWGDPHYQSFDGRNFNFQGTCDYVLATTECPTGNATGLTPFTITTKNENRGNPAVSYVKQVTVSTLGVNISIHKKEKGHVRVNQVLTALPVSEAGGRITVTQGPGKAVLVTNFGLQVTYDWNARVEVTLPSSYSDAVCGLCGNMDRNVSNDRVFPNGTLAPSNTAWGGSWRVPDSDPFCWDECQGSCPSCSEDQLEQFSGPGFCGPLASGSGGPFAACHAHVPPESYFKGCVIDVCFGGGSQDILCQALAAYAAACQAAGVVIEDWRTQLGCEMPCPQNSHYELCGNPCPASCPSPLPPPEPAQCEGPCAEGCQCDEGFVLSAGQCVSLDSGCGCWVNGTYHEAGSEFWADSTCSQRCRCGPGNSSVVCSPASCGQGEECGLLPSGQLGCRPTSTAECKAWGDPHYLTLDGHRYNFQGACEYLLSAPCHGLPHGLENFTVTVANEHRGSQAVSYTRSASLYIYNHNLTVSSRWPRQLQVDGVLVALPFQLDSRLHAYLSGRDVVVKAANGISMAYDGKSDLRLRVPAAYQGILCGLCGNYNQNATDDPQAVGKNPGQWQVGGTEDCDKCVPGPCPPQCTPEQQAQFAGPDACGIISAPNGPLAPCHHLVPPNQFFEACLLDACQAQGHQEGLCQAVAAYVAACQAAGAQIDEWRRPDFCPLQCPANSHYQLCGDSCPVSCPSLSTPEGCEPACIEGCVCDAGFVLSGDTCVPVGQCGCLHEGRYYPLGQTFYPGPECGRRCECRPGGKVHCQQGTTCRPYEECRVQDGVQACFPTGCGRCVASGGVHYITLDGRVYDLHGSCSYVLARVCWPQPGDEDFSIVLEKDAAGDVQRLLITVSGLAVSLGRGSHVTVDGEVVTLPVAVGSVRVTAEGRNMILQTTEGLRLLYDGEAYVLISIPSSFRDRVCGLCGNFNGNWSDDLALPNGQLASSVETFGAAWRTPNSPPGCTEGCGPQGCPVCLAEQTAPYESLQACGRLQDPNGPFKACHDVLNPSEYFRQCVYDLCAYKGNFTYLCRSLAAYTAACQAAGVEVKPWRTDSFCPLQCPANSHYSICTHTCQGSCAGVSGLTGCTGRCFEGCECNDRFLLSQGVCIPIQDCGCSVDGRYLPTNTSLLSSDCSKRCFCSASGLLSCQAAGCPQNLTCEVQAGSRDCWVPHDLCSLSPGGKLTTFDGFKNTITSPGVYEVSSRCPGLKDIIPWYRVLADVHSCHDKLEAVRLVHVFFQDGLVTLTPSNGVWVNGVQVNLPAKVLTSISVTRQPDGSMVVQQKGGVRVQFHPSGKLDVMVGQTHAGMLCGACGNFDGDQANDKPQDQTWRAPDFSSCYA